MIKNISLLLRSGARNFSLPLNGENVGGLSAALQEKSAFNVRALAVTLTNNGSSEITLLRAYIRVMLEPGPYEYYFQSSRWSQENRGFWRNLDDQGVVLTHKEGRTTGGNTPYCALRQIGYPQTLSFHIAPVGNWRIRIIPQFFSNTEPPVAVDLGMRDEELAYTLAPGESWTLPEVLIQESSDFDSAMPQLHDFLYSVYPEHLAKELPVIYNTWFDRFNDLDVPHLREELAAAKEIGCETFVVDAGWFGEGESCGVTGDWREKTDDAFYGKMQDFANEVRSAGLNFGLWMEMERYEPTVPIVKKHPEWFIATNLNKNLRIDLDNPAAAEYLQSEIQRLIDTYDLEYIKFDMNATLGFDDTGKELNSYQSKFLEIIDNIKSNNPGVILENCSSGALRCDLACMKHFDLSFPSDNANAFTMLMTMRGLWRRFLPGRILRWCVMREIKDHVAQMDAANTIIMPGEATFEEYERADLESLLIGNFTGGAFGFSGDIASLSPANRQLVKKYVDLYKSRRHFLNNARGHWLVDTDRLQQFELELNGNAIIVTAYLACDQHGKRRVYPKNLLPEAFYNINGQRQRGKELMQNGFTVELCSHQQYQWRCVMSVLDKE